MAKEDMHVGDTGRLATSPAFPRDGSIRAKPLRRLVTRSSGGVHLRRTNAANSLSKTRGGTYISALFLDIVIQTHLERQALLGFGNAGRCWRGQLHQSLAQ